MSAFTPRVLSDRSRPVLVFSKGRTKYHAISARDRDIALVTLDTLRGLSEVTRNGEPYPPKRAASYWLNRDHREVTKRAKAVLRALVARKQGAA